LSGNRQRLPDGYEVLLEKAGQYDIVIRTKAKAELEKKASAEQLAGLEDLIERYAKEGPKGVPPKKWNGAEGWFPSDKAPGKVRLEALKPWQLRAYGFCCEFRGRPTLFITGIDPAKKQDKADRAILDAAGREAFRVSKLM
jgi:hypothetical protein